MADAAVAVAPGLIPRDKVGYDARQVLGCADLYARKHRERVVLFTDLTRMFTGAGTSWAQLGVYWETALRELREGPFPAMYLTITERAHGFDRDCHSSNASTTRRAAASSADDGSALPARSPPGTTRSAAQTACRSSRHTRQPTPCPTRSASSASVMHTIMPASAARSWASRT